VLANSLGVRTCDPVAARVFIYVIRTCRFAKRRAYVYVYTTVRWSEPNAKLVQFQRNVQTVPKF
jgi:hypothetical protein